MILWFLIGFNITMICFNFFTIRKTYKQVNKNLEDSKKFLEQAKKQAAAVQEVYDKEMNYCKICKTIIKLRK